MFLNAIYLYALGVVSGKFVAFPCAALEKKKRKFSRTFLCTHVNKSEKKCEERGIRKASTPFFFTSMYDLSFAL